MTGSSLYRHRSNTCSGRYDERLSQCRAWRECDNGRRRGRSQPLGVNSLDQGVDDLRIIIIQLFPHQCREQSRPLEQPRDVGVRLGSAHERRKFGMGLDKVLRLILELMKFFLIAASDHENIMQGRTKCQVIQF